MTLTSADARWVFDRLDWAHIAEVASNARHAWETGVPVFEVGLMPGDGTHYGLVFAVLGESVPVLSGRGGGTGDRTVHSASGCRFDGSYAVVTYVQRSRSLVVGFSEFVHPSRLDVFDTTPGSTLALAAFLNALTQATPGWESNYADSLGD